MDWGSSYIYDYQGESEEEVLSEGELEEGMWMSDSDDEDENPPPRAAPPKAGVFQRTQTAKPPKPRDDDGSSGSEEDDEDDASDEDQFLTRQTGYAELSFEPKEAVVSKIKAEEEEVEGSPGKYAQLKELQDEIRGQKPGDPPLQLKTQSAATPVPAPPDIITPKAHSVTVPLPPPPPPIKQLHGIMKGEMKKQKKQRVRWDKSYRSKRSDGSQGIKTRRADTNILAVRFNTLREAGHLHTGDAQFCSNPECGAVVSHLTKLIGEEDDEKKIWNCEFCGTATELDIVPEEIPSKDDTTYLITPAAIMAEGGGGAGTIGMDESLVVFCIDTSGSMCVTTKVPGHYDIRGAKEKREKMLQSLPADVAADLRQPEYRFMQGRQQNVTWISRMESLQAAVDTQLSQLVHSEPNKRVSVVTFSDDVTIIGDGRMVPVTIAGEKLSDTKAVIDVGREIPLPATVRETQKALSKKVFSLEESGQTALGPAALASVVIASQRPGSRVVLCTDGLANVGLGSLDVTGNAQAYAMAENFYEDLGDVAMEKGVTVSLLSIKGSDCRVIELGQVATRTGGQTTLVDPLTVTEEFGSILSNPVLATDVVTKIVLHNDVYFRTEDSKENVIVKQVGNVTADTELTFEYGVRTKSPKPPAATTDQDEGDDVKVKAGATATADKVVPPQLVNGQPQLPFQLQIEYTNSDGDRCLRVITHTKPVTQDRIVAERAMDTGLIGSHVAKKAAELTMQGEFTQARVKSLATQRLLQKHSHTSASRRWEYSNWCSNMIPLEHELHRMQASERSQGRDLSDEEVELYEGESELMSTSYAAPRSKSHTRSVTAPIFSSKTQSAPMPKMRKSKEAMRRRDISDELAYGVYGLQKTSSTAFKSPRFATENVPSHHRSAPEPHQRAVTIATVPSHHREDREDEDKNDKDNKDTNQ